VAGILVLLIVGLIPLYALWLLAKDAVAAPAAVRRSSRGGTLRSMGLAGKLVTLGQGVAVLWLLLALPYGLSVTMFVGLLGLIVGVVYAIRGR